MSWLDNPIIRHAPYADAIRCAVVLLAAGGLLALVWSWHDRGQRLEAAETLQATIVNAATIATVKPDEKGHRTPLRPEQVPAAIQVLANGLTSAETALRGISQGALSAKAASDVADAALARDLDAMQRRSAGGKPDAWDPWGGRP